jgi:hypothetical protein
MAMGAMVRGGEGGSRGANHRASTVGFGLGHNK